MFRYIYCQSVVTRLVSKSHRSFYDCRTKYDTIFAPSTCIHPTKGSPLGVIRISGPKTQFIIEKLTNYRVSRDENPGKSNVKLILPRVATLSKFFSPNPDAQELVDIGITLWFPKPRSFTGEDVVELHLHGSQAILTRLMDILANFDSVRPAEPGEFTRRAVSNDKLSLLQAESLPDLIASQTEKQRQLALKGLDGTTRLKYNLWIDQLVNNLAHLEASIDFGEDELIGEERVVGNCIQELVSLSKAIKMYIEANSRSRQFAKNGFKIAIIGKPNAGKSSLMNLLCQREKAIVSDLAGTTRDVIEHSFELSGHKVSVSDTAGLRHIEMRPSQHDCHSDIEREGIKRALGECKKADLILFIIDGAVISRETGIKATIGDIKTVIDLIGEQQKRLHLVINKIDVSRELTLSLDTLKEIISYPAMDISYISCKTKEGYDPFVESIGDILDGLIHQSCHDIDTYQSIEYVNERHLSLLKAAQRHLAIASRMHLETIDEMAQHVREAVDYLSRIVGVVSNDEILDVIFRDFCIGK